MRSPNVTLPRQCSKLLLPLVILGTLLLVACGGAATSEPVAGASAQATEAPQDQAVPTRTPMVSLSTPTLAPEAPTATPLPTPTPGAVFTAKDSIILVTSEEPDSLGAWNTGCSGNVPSMVCEELTSDPMTWINTDTFVVEPLTGFESWQEIDPDRWRFRLRQGIVFHDGEPFTAEAAKLGLDIHGDAGRGIGGYSFHGTIHGEVVDDLTVDVVCDVPCPIFPRMAIFTKFQSPKWWAAATEDDTPRTTIGLGPYKVVEWHAGVEVELEAFEDYKPNNAFGSRAPSIQRAFQVWRGEALVRAAMVGTGEADWATEIGFENRNEVPKFKTGTNNEVYTLVFDTIWHPELRKKEVRQALVLAVDCQQLMEAIYDNLQKCFGNISQEGTVGVTPENSADYGYDPDRARELLQQAGYDPANEIVIHARANRVAQDVELNEATINFWREVGVTANLQILEASAARNVRRSGCGQFKTEALRCHEMEAPAPLGASSHAYETATSNEALDYQRQSILRLSCFNVNSRVCDPALEEKIDIARATPLGDLRRERMEELGNLAHDEVYFMPYFQVISVYGLAANLEWEPRYDPRTRVNTMSFSQ